MPSVALGSRLDDNKSKRHSRADKEDHVCHIHQPLGPTFELSRRRRLAGGYRLEGRVRRHCGPRHSAGGGYPGPQIISRMKLISRTNPTPAVSDDLSPPRDTEAGAECLGRDLRNSSRLSGKPDRAVPNPELHGKDARGLESGRFATRKARSQGSSRDVRAVLVLTEPMARSSR